MVYDADSVAALIVTANRRYVLQRRDDVRGVDFPGYLGLFGGAVEPGESCEVAMLRELEEELAFVPDRMTAFATLEFDERASAGWYCRRRYFEVLVYEHQIETMKVREGNGMDILDCTDLMKQPAVIPYDLCAILMHERQATSRAALAEHRERSGAK